MRLHKNIGLFRDAVAITADYKELSEVYYVEKDYWVTLKASIYADNLTFIPALSEEQKGP